MPEVFRTEGYVFFFYSNEGREPMHVHVRRGGGFAKFLDGAGRPRQRAGIEDPGACAGGEADRGSRRSDKAEVG